MENSTIYFTYKIFARSGFTDQLDRFKLCYFLGCSLNFVYLHSSFNLPRSSENLDEFFGLSKYFDKCISDINSEDIQYIDIFLNELFSSNIFGSLDELKTIIHDFVNEHSEENSKYKVVRFELARFSKGKMEVIDKNTGLRSKQFPPAVQLEKWSINSLIGKLDFRSIYSSTRIKNPVPQKSNSGNLRAIVHIRQGDLAVIKSPWNSFLPVGKQNCFKEIHNLNEVGDTYINPNEYLKFLMELSTHLPWLNSSLSVFSDGYRRGFDKIRQNIGSYNFTDKQVSELFKLESRYDDLEFEPFYNKNNWDCFIGEKDEHLYKLIDGCINADIFIVGTQQHMLPKFLRLFPRAKAPPILIVLCKNDLYKRGWKYETLEPLTDKQASIISVRIDKEYNVLDIVSELKEKILTYSKLVSN